MPHRGTTWGGRAAPARVAATAIALLGMVALAGWAFQLPALTRVMPGAVEMKANTAVALILCGLSLMIFAAPAAPRLERTGQIMALVAVAIGLASLAEYVFAWQLGIDEFLFRDGGSAYNVFRGRMSPFSAAGFVLAGLALATLHRAALRKAVKWAAGLVMLIGAVSLIGYLWNAGELVTDAWLPPVAVNTALCFVLLGGGILLTQRGAAARNTQPATLTAIEIKILAGFLLVISLLLFGGAYTYRTSAALANSVEWVAHTQEVRAALANLYGSLSGAELAQRDYLLTGKQARLGDYSRLVDAVHHYLGEFGRLTNDNAAQRRNSAALGAVVEIYLQDLDASLCCSIGTRAAEFAGSTAMPCRCSTPSATSPASAA